LNPVTIPPPYAVAALIVLCLVLAFLALILTARGTVYSTIGQYGRANMRLAAAVLCILVMQFAAFLAGVLW